MNFQEIYKEHEIDLETIGENESIDIEKSEDGKEDTSSLGGAEYVDRTSHIPLLGYFGYEDGEQATEKDRQKLLDIAEYANGFDSDIIKYIRFVEDRIGDPSIGVSRLDHVYRYIVLKKESSVANKRAQEYATQNSNRDGSGPTVIRIATGDVGGPNTEGD